MERKEEKAGNERYSTIHLVLNGIILPPTFSIIESILIPMVSIKNKLVFEVIVIFI